MAEINYTNEPIDTTSEFYRECNNNEHGCDKKEFMANNLQVGYCTDKCKDAFNNRKKRMLNAGISKVNDSNLNKIMKLWDNNKNVSLKATELMAFGIDLSKSNEVIILDPNNNRVLLRFGDFYLQRIEKDSVRIFTKDKMNDGK
ncbi:MAG: Uncharacterised protein [Cryomorphaceae bacterium]|jgi:hypothetical protein|nr:MAG: Uncharacterised protein [Cryomorphaceae bacterium]|tara:strand:- start:1703 stop:2134 length:432 start_codon:yes stop_codon:yes gene_type:complete